MRLLCVAVLVAIPAQAWAAERTWESLVAGGDFSAAHFDLRTPGGILTSSLVARATLPALTAADIGSTWTITPQNALAFGFEWYAAEAQLNAPPTINPVVPSSRRQ